MQSSQAIQKSQKKQKKLKNQIKEEVKKDVKQVIKKTVRHANAIQLADNSPKIFSRYLNALQNPEENKVGIPGLFADYTSLFYFKHSTNLVIQSSQVEITILPWNLVTPSGNNPSWFNVNWVQPAPFVDVGIEHPMKPYMGTLDNVAARYSSYRVVSTTLKIEYTGVLTDFSGIITASYYPGLGYNNKFPTISNMLQKPYAYQEPIKTGVVHKVVYIPIDPLDHIFHDSSEPSDNMRLRSPIFVALSNCTMGMTFTLILETLIEYIPLGQFCGWVDAKIRPPDPHTYTAVQQTAITHPHQLFKGQIPEMPRLMTQKSFVERLGQVVKKGVKNASKQGGLIGLIGGLVKEVAYDDSASLLNDMS